jgi:two-component system, sensor histidine kinase
MNVRTLSAAEALASFDMRNDSNGLFLRYCRGRLDSLVTRLAMSLTGAAGVALLADAVAGLLIAVLLALGETADSLVLRWIVRRWGVGDAFVPLRARRAATASGAFQALTVCIAVSVTWFVGPSGETHFYATAFLIGAAINAGLLLPHDPSSNGLRLLLFGCTLIALNLQDITGALTDPARGPSELFGPVASLMLAYMTGMVILFLKRTHARRSEDARTILVEQARLEAAGQDLDRASQEASRLALVARHANDAVILYNRDGLVEWINDGFTRMMGYAAEEVVGRRIEEAVPAPDADLKAVTALIEARRSFSPCRVEFLSRHKLGRPIWIETSLTPVAGADGTPDRIIAVEREITEAKAREAELARARLEAEEGARAKERFLATMSHEIRTPMNGVIGTAELLAETDLDRDQRLYVDTIVESGQALLSIINDVLDLSRLQSGAGAAGRDPFDLRSVLGGVLTLLTPTARAKGISLDGPSDCGALSLLGDAGRIRQILTNLVGNAIKFTETGGVTVDLRVRPAGDSATIEIAVADTGIGIPADRTEGIFESFTQADGEISRRFDGRHRHTRLQPQMEDRPDRPVADRHRLLQAADVPVGLPQPAGHDRSPSA